MVEYNRNKNRHVITQPVPSKTGFCFSFRKPAPSTNFYLNVTKTNKDANYLPSWLREAKSYKIIKSCGDLIDPIAKNIINKTIKNVEVELNKSDSGINALDANNKIIKQNLDSKSDKNPSNNDSNNDNIGYSKKEIEKMDRLIDVIAK